MTTNIQITTETLKNPLRKIEKILENKNINLDFNQDKTSTIRAQIFSVIF
jgi:hypothetical protein